MNSNASTAVRSLSNLALAAMCCSVLVMGAVAPAMADQPIAFHSVNDGGNHVGVR